MAAPAPIPLKSFSLPKWRRAHIWAALGVAFVALLATGRVLIALELLVYVARVLPWRPTVAILAWVERFFFTRSGDRAPHALPVHPGQIGGICAGLR